MDPAARNGGSRSVCETRDFTTSLFVMNKKPYYDPNGWEGYDHNQNLFGRQLAFSASYKFW